jgi:drug/metabolite transporter (DMT)-like permease
MFFRSKPPNAASLAGVLIAVTLADLNPIFSKVLLLEGLTPLQLYFGVLLVMNLFLLVHEMMALERGERWGMTRSDFLGTVLSTLTGGICAPMLFFTGLQSITASEGIILTSLLPFFIIVFAVLLRNASRCRWRLGVVSCLLV